MIITHLVNSLLGLVAGTLFGVVALASWDSGDPWVLVVGGAGLALWYVFLGITRWVHLGATALTAPLHGRVRWADVADVRVGEVTGTIYFPRTGVILTVATTDGQREVALTEVSRKVGNPKTDALAIECERRVASAHGNMAVI